MVAKNKYFISAWQIFRTQAVLSSGPAMLKAVSDFDIKKPEDTVAGFQVNPDFAPQTGSL